MTRRILALLILLPWAAPTYADDVQSTVDTLTYCLNVVLAQDEGVAPVPNNGLMPDVRSTASQWNCRIVTSDPATVVEATQALVAVYPEPTSVLNLGFNGAPDTLFASVCSGATQVIFVVNGQDGQDPNTGFVAVAAFEENDVC